MFVNAFFIQVGLTMQFDYAPLCIKTQREKYIKLEIYQEMVSFC